ncbi:hypothetical protein N9B73_02920 [Verrucomicrobiales bacterium]|nr:hypothetical protein [Verrucomicrobiales bacterium]
MSEETPLSNSPEEPTPINSESSTELEVSPNVASADESCDRIVRSHVLWAMGAGLIPLPLADIAGVTAIQMDALKQLAENYGVDYREANGKRFVTGLAGSTAARIGASAVKAIPGIGTVIGGLSMSALSGASTYAVCQVAISHFKKHGNFLELDIEEAKAGYKSALEKGKTLVTDLAAQAGEARKVHEQISKLESLRDDGVLSDLEFEAKKAALKAKLDKTACKSPQDEAECEEKDSSNSQS